MRKMLSLYLDNTDPVMSTKKTFILCNTNLYSSQQETCQTKGHTNGKIKGYIGNVVSSTESN